MLLEEVVPKKLKAMTNGGGKTHLRREIVYVNLELAIANTNLEGHPWVVLPIVIIDS
ncbi:MAG: hypothetical protein INH43_27920 [Acidobacteriaceae bacterium]|nr:hypothetical protein [Acidobacteriaceae bacterium]